MGWDGGESPWDLPDLLLLPRIRQCPFVRAGIEGAGTGRGEMSLFPFALGGSVVGFRRRCRLADTSWRRLGWRVLPGLCGIVVRVVGRLILIPDAMGSGRDGRSHLNRASSALMAAAASWVSRAREEAGRDG